MAVILKVGAKIVARTKYGTLHNIIEHNSEVSSYQVDKTKKNADLQLPPVNPT